MVELVRVNEENFGKVVDMQLPPEPRLVAPNVVSLAQAWLNYEEARPFAVCHDGEAVGFIMLDWDEKGRSLGIWRFMIAPEHQKKGYGTQAVEAVIAMARETGAFDQIDLDVVPGNTVAKAMYEKLGFAETGEVEDGELVMVRKL